MVKDINSGSSSSNPFNLVAFGNTLCFRADDGTNGDELWKSDGSSTGTLMIKDLHSGSSSSNPYNLVALGNTLYFQANDGISGIELYAYSGTYTEIYYG